MEARPKSMREYLDASQELFALQQQLNDAKGKDKPYELTRLIQAGGGGHDETKYRTDPAYKARFTPEQISYLDRIHLLKDQVDLQAAKCVSKWCECVTMFNPDCYVFSIGSGGQPKQQIPEFAKQRNDGFTAILNLDQFKFAPDKTPHYHSSYLGAHLNANTKFMEAFIEHVGKLLESGKKVIIFDFSVPTHVMHYKDLLEKHKKYLDKSLSFFQGYFASCPVFQVHARAITRDIDRNLHDVIEAFEGGVSTPELKNPPPEFTTRYAHLDNISYANLFKPEMAGSLPSEKPSKTAETLFSHPERYDKKILDKFFENRETFDKTPDGIESWKWTNQALINSLLAMIPEQHRADVDLFTIKRSEIEKLIQAGGTERLKK